MRKGFRWFVVYPLLGLLVVVTVQEYDRRQRDEHDQWKSERSACQNNLRQINACVQEYLLLNNTSTVPSSAAITSMFNGGVFPTCPAGGTYTLPATEADLPTCTLGQSKGHRLSP